MTSEQEFFSEMGKRIRGARKRLNITQSDLGARLGIAQEMVSRYETGSRELSAVEIQNFAKALGVSVAFLYGEATEPSELEAIANAMLPTLRDFIIHMLRGDLGAQFLVLKH